MATAHYHQLLLLLSIIVCVVQCTHFRGGTINWAAKPDNTVTFTFIAYWNVSYVGINYNFTMGDGNTVKVKGKISANNSDYTTVIATFSHQYAKSTTVNSYLVEITECCRISFLRSGKDERWRLQSLVNLGGDARTSSSSNLPPIVPFGIGKNNLQVSAIKPGSWSLVPTSQSGLSQPAFVTRASVQPISISATGLISWTTSIADVGLWAFQIRHTSLEGYTSIDFIIKVEPTYIDDNPPVLSFNPPTKTYALLVGAPLNFDVGCATTIGTNVTISTPALFDDGMGLGGAGNSVQMVKTAGNGVPTTVPFSWPKAVITNGATNQDFVIPFTCTSSNGLADTQLIQVSVSSPLSITCPAAATVSCLKGPVPDDQKATVSTGCYGPTTVTYVDEAYANSCGSTVKRTWTGSDACLQTATCDQLITVNDKTNPTLTNVPGPKTVSCFANSGYCGSQVPFASDNCDPAPQITQSDSTSNGTSSCSNTLTRTFTATDACKNFVSQTQIITINDGDAPTITPKMGSYSVECARDLNLLATVDDNCDSTRYISSDNTPTSCGQQSITWTTKDTCGNPATKTVQVTIGHQNKPKCSSYSYSSSVTCASAVSTIPAPTCTSYCGDDLTPSLKSTSPNKIGNCTVSVRRTWTATDSCGNNVEFNEDISVNKKDSPDLYTPNDFHGECGSSIDVSNIGKATAYDDCEGDITPAYEDQQDPGYSVCTQSISRIWTATDSCGNKATTVQKIILTDSTAPSYKEPPPYNGQCASELTLDNTHTPVLTDCTGATYSYKDTVTSTNGGYSDCRNSLISRQWTVVDSCQNSASFYQLINITDDTVPRLQLPIDTSVECAIKATVNNTGTAVAYDNCDPTVTITATFTDQAFSDKILRTWTASDACGNSVSGVQTILLINSAPGLIVPNNTQVPCESGTSPATTGYATASDGCSGSMQPTYTDSRSGTCPTVITRTWSVTDSNTGQSTTGVQTITVGHAEGPFVSAPDDVAVQCPFQSGVGYTGNGTVWALCGEEVTLEYTDKTYDGYIIRTWKAKDSCGHEGSQDQKITIKDTVAPTVVAPPGVQTNCYKDTSVYDHGTATATDNCDETSKIVITHDDQLLPGRGDCGASCPSIKRVWTAKDTSGNVATANQLIEIYAQAPTFNTTDSNIHIDCYDELSSIPLVSATDSCGDDAPISKVDQVNTYGCGYSIQRTWTASDNCGTKGTFVQSITVSDSEEPYLSHPLPLNVQCEADIPTDNVVSASDNCVGVGKPYFVDFSRQDGCPINIDRRWYVKDACGNSAESVKQAITILKVKAPTLDIPLDVNVSCGTPCTADLTGTGAAASVDVCGKALTPAYVDYKYEESDGTIVIKRTWSVSDDCGNSNSGVQVIRISTDTPVVTMPADYTGICGSSTDPDVTGRPTWESKCGTVEATYYDPVGCPIYGNFRRKWTLTRGGAVVFSAYQSITRQNCQPDSLQISNLTVELGSRPYTVWPTVHVDDLDIPCESVTLVWIWSDGSNSTQICDVSSPCSGCQFNGTGLDATYAHTYNYPGIYKVRLFVYDARASLPAEVPVAQTGTPITGPGWISLSFDSVGVYDPTSGAITGSLTYFSPEDMYVSDSELSGNAFLIFNARFYQTGDSFKSSGQLNLQIGTVFDFTSTAYTHLTVSPATDALPARAIWTGVGTLNGNAGYLFSIFASDSDDGSKDRVRIQISDPSQTVVYDTALGTALDINTLPDDIPDSVRSVIIKDPPPTTVSALTDETSKSTPASSEYSSSTLIIVIAVLGALLLVVSVICVVLFLKFKAVNANVAATQSGDSFRKL